MKPQSVNHDPPLKVGFSEETLREFGEIADEREITKSELLRQWVRIGYRVEQNLIPEFEDKNKASSESFDNRGPIETLFEEELPDEESEAIEISELQERITDRVNNRVVELFRESDVVGMKQGKLFKNEE